MPKHSKAMSLRLSEDDAADLATVARADGMAQADVVRLALRQYINRRCEDDDFQDRLAASLDRTRRSVERLSK
jgi:hypothetical protein